MQQQAARTTQELLQRLEATQRLQVRIMLGLVQLRQVRTMPELDSKPKVKRVRCLPIFFRGRLTFSSKGGRRRANRGQRSGRYYGHH
jgi:hypothetical protein